MKAKKAKPLLIAGFIAGVVVFGYGWFRRELAPAESGEPLYFHVARPERLAFTLNRLQSLKVIRDESALRIYGWFHGASGTVRAGTYLVRPGMDADEILASLSGSIHKKFRFPETNWARRNANLLQKAQVTTAKDYLAWVHEPEEFQNEVSFRLPHKTLEGYLYPDTYDLPPLTGARTVVNRQLRAFENKVVGTLGPDAASYAVIRKASLIELETGTDQDRAMIAGVIENRLRKGMPLQIDAGIMYALGKWRRLYFKDYKDVDSPYNLYRHKGLPPTPICSPSLKSIVAALHPAQHKYLYYVAMPDGHSIYAKTPAEHEHNIRLRKLALAAQKKRKTQIIQLLTPTSRSSDSNKGKA